MLIASALRERTPPVNDACNKGISLNVQTISDRHAPVSRRARARTIRLAFFSFVLAPLMTLLSCSDATAQNLAPDPLPALYPTTNGFVYAMAFVGPSNEIIIGGSFSSVDGHPVRNLARILANGTVATGWSPVVNGNVEAVAVASDGSIYIGGSFTNVNGVARSRLARFNPDGTLDTSWNFPASATVHDLAINNGNLYVGGAFEQLGGQPRRCLGRIAISSSPALDPDWKPACNATGVVRTILTASATHIYAGGNFGLINDQDTPHLAKISVSGSGAVDITFRPHPNGTVNTLAADGTNFLLVGGDFVSVNGFAQPYLAKVATTNGALQTWNVSPNASVRSLAPITGGGFFVAGDFTSIGVPAVSRSRIARFATTSTTTPTGAWGSQTLDNPIRKVITTVTGSSRVGGTFSTVDSDSRFGFARFDANGLLLTSADAELYGEVRAVASDNNGGWVIGGAFKKVNGYPIRNLARSDASGQLVTGWTPQPDGHVWSIVISDGHAYVGGSFTALGALARERLARIPLSGSGTLDPVWTANADSTVATMADDGTGNLIVGGAFGNINGVARNRIARISKSGVGALDTNFVGPAFNNEVRSIAVDGTSKIYVGGSFTTPTTSRLVRLDFSTGERDLNFNPSANQQVSALALDAAGSSLYAGGSFTSIGTYTNWNYLVKLSTQSATTYPTWMPIWPSDAVTSLLRDADGSLYYGRISASSTQRLVTRLINHSNHTATVDDTFNPALINTAGTSSAYTIAQDANGTIAISGTFDRASGEYRSGLAFFTPATSPQYRVGGTVSGLAGSGLAVSLNGDPLSISANGTFEFPNRLDSGSTYNVTVSAQPTNPSQECTVANGTGTIAGSDVTNVSVTCTTLTFSVGGSIVGLAGSGLVLSTNGQNLPVSANGSFTFPTPVASGSAYAVSVTTQPQSPMQTCTVANGSGTISNAAISNVSVTCTTNAYTLGGTVSGLSGSGLVLSTNGQNVSVAASGNFSFPTPLPSGTAYAVTVTTQPQSPSQICLVSNGTGVIAGAAVNNVQVNCTTITHVISVSSGPNGIISFVPGQGFTMTTVPDGAQAQIQIQPNSGYIMDTFNNGCGGTLSGGILTTAPITANCAISVTFRPVTTTGDLQISLDAETPFAQPGAALIYTLIATNAGPDSSAATTVQVVPNPQLTDMEWSCEPALSTTPCPAPPDGIGAMSATVNLPAGKHLTFFVGGIVNASIGDSLALSATIAPGANHNDPVTTNNTATATVLVGDRIFAHGFEVVSPAEHGKSANSLTVPEAEVIRSR
jgi:hypothetical protein